ncbi:MAG TPA: hypothetical protein VEL07_06000 [Planctomycetota bacterium]|nr:hypothetical protein [Planctomycetota bacterium]
MSSRLITALCAASIICASASAGEATDAAPGQSAAAAPSGDIIFLTNGQRLLGAIDERAAARDDKVLVRLADGGQIRIRRDLVKSEERGYESRRKALKDGDFSGAVELARWCLTKDMKAEALELFALALGWQANAAPDAVLTARAAHAALVDELNGPEAALALYQGYRDAGGKDAATLARLAELDDAVRQHQAKLKPAANVEGASVAAVTKPTGDDRGLESRRWEGESLQYSNPVVAKTVDVDTVEGKNKVLDLTFTADPQRKGGRIDKAAIRRAMPAPLGERTTLTFWAKNLGKFPLRMSVGIKTGEWVFHESALQTIAAKDEWALLRFDLTASTFKSEATEWNNNGTIQNLDQIKEVQFLVYHGLNDGHLQLDQIQFVAPGMQ